MSSGFKRFGVKIFQNYIPNFKGSKIPLSTINLKFNNFSRRTKILSISGIVGAATLGVCYTLNESVKAAHILCHPQKLPWPQDSGLGIFLGTFDHASVRRGWEVYKQVCAACHSLNFVSYREFVNQFMTEEEAKAEAAEIQVLDGPDAKGNMFLRPGKLFDTVPAPYPNEEAARAANNGASPPDLSFITLARHGGANYVFALLRGYCDAPAGHAIEEGQYFNPYFLGGNISMPPPLFNETIEYSDGTPATASQLAKDVVHFLNWCAEPEMTEKKQILIRSFIVLGAMMCFTWIGKRIRWSTIVSRKIIYKDVHNKKD